MMWNTNVRTSCIFLKKEMTRKDKVIDMEDRKQKANFRI
jgi:hypothetical protein